MIADKILTGGKLLVGEEIVEGALAIDEGNISWIGKESRKPPASETILLNGRVILPGIIDMHVHLRDQNLSRKETFCTGSKAAAVGGVTSIADMPNNDPPTDNPQALERRMKAAEGRIYVNVAFYSLLRSNQSMITAINRSGAIGFKVFMYNPLDGSDPEDEDFLTLIFRRLKEEDMFVAVHAESRKILSETASGMTKEELMDPEMYPEIRPPRAEAEAVARIIGIVRNVGGPTHLCHLSTRPSVQIVREAKGTGAPVTCEVTPHHLLLSSSQMRRLGSRGIVNPPLRSQDNIASLWEGIKDSTVDVLGSDHAPHQKVEKDAGSGAGIPPGFPGLETLASTMLTQVSMGRMSLSRFVRMTSTNPARILGLTRRGSLRKGYHADLIIVDLRKEGRVDPSMFESKAKYSPFEGYETRGEVTVTIVGGQVVMEEGEIVGSEASGKILIREHRQKRL